eukprot:1160079-Pelagomonas_calceolata.AAC.2
MGKDDSIHDFQNFPFDTDERFVPCCGAVLRIVGNSGMKCPCNAALRRTHSAHVQHVQHGRTTMLAMLCCAVKHTLLTWRKACNQ